MLGIVNDLPS